MNNKQFPVWDHYYEWFQGYPVFIQIALVIILLSVLLFLLGNASLAFDRMRVSYRKSRTAAATSIVSAELVGGLIAEDEQTENDFDKFVNRLSSLTSKSNFFKQIVIDQIIYYHRNFTDSTEHMLDRLFSKLELADSMIYKLKSRSWVKIARGLREMQEMKVTQSVDKYIDPLLNDLNNDLRIEAQAAYLRLNKENPFDFLSVITEELLPLHQIILFEIVVNTPEIPIPDLSKYLKSKNNSVLSFSMKLAAYYHQFEVIPELMSLLDHKAEHIRIEAVSILGKLNAEEGEPDMIARFPAEDLKVQLKILESVGEIKSGNQLSFLKEQFLSSEEFAFTKTAACALSGYPGFDKDEFISESSEISGELTTIINHCANTLIRN